MKYQKTEGQGQESVISHQSSVTKRMKPSKGRARNRPAVTHYDAIPEGVLLYTKHQMADAMQVSMRCLGEMMRRGEISYLKIGRKMVRFQVEDAMRRLKESTLVCRKESVHTNSTNFHEGINHG